MLLAEELTLLALDPETGRLRGREARVDHALAGALLLDLAAAGHLRLEPGDVLVLGDTSPKEPLLGSGLSLLTGQFPVGVCDAIRHLALTLRETVLDSMAERGMLRREVHRTLVLKILVRWYAASPDTSAVVREDLQQIFTTAGATAPEPGAELEPRAAGLVTVLDGADLLELVSPARPDAAQVRSWCATPRAGGGDELRCAVHTALCSLADSAGAAGVKPGPEQRTASV
ncbi:GPP34 family phosphoprotein [Mumia sp. DW29H23]|uniref:GPP34 family phosphoprotein n=1 Tax=Mumia sp. DW29H23 TaxID=3421241 RepID=UPI003D69B8C2